MSHDTGRPGAPQDTPSSPSGDKTHHKPLVAAAATTAMTVIGEIANQKYGAYVPDWLLLLGCLFTLYLCGYWLWTHEKIKRQRRLIYTHPRMSFVIMVVAGAVIGGGVAALLWRGANRQPVMVEQPAPTPQPPPIHSDLQFTAMRLRRMGFPQAFIDVQFQNGSGVMPVDSAAILAKAFFRPIRIPIDPENIPVLDDMFAESVRDADKIPNFPIRLGPSAKGQATIGGKELAAMPMQEFMDGKRVVYLMGGIMFSDSTGHYRKAFCHVLAPPNIKVHDDLKYGEHWLVCPTLPSMTAWEAKATEDTY